MVIATDITPALASVPIRDGNDIVLRRLKVLLLKPYQQVVASIQSPPLGLLYLVSSLREKFGDDIDIKVIDMKVEELSAQALVPLLQSYQPDVIGFSALNYEAQASYSVARIAKQINPAVITVMGGPFALNNAATVLEELSIDWVFEGPADHTFPEALYRLACDIELGEDIAGFSRRLADGSLYLNQKQDFIADIDTLPMPAWDMVDFDLYASKPNHAANLRGKRYMTLFTSRGCPYLCNYCHDIFSKKFSYHSVERVIAEIDHLYTHYGVDEFHIEDDIFNLHKPRVRQLMREVQRRWQGKIKFAFPNGLRADILDKETVDAMCDGGTYAVCIAIETVTPRLQALIEKNLDIDKAKEALGYFYDRNVQSTCFFMLGFPTETAEELEATINFALTTPMTLAYFFTVIPQPNTPLFGLALKENEAITLDSAKVDSGSYRGYTSWYERVYGYPLGKVIRRANMRFYFTPRRVVQALKHWSLRSLWVTFRVFLQVVFNRTAAAPPAE
ncbi:MAG: B12-binding domain-containing radical SAM protein [Pseudomonadales bacterium]|nr:B12-binding domain-containing radical SAM protein [Pseudomonadales bacterium]